jgi:hypothetical protein
MSRDRGFAALEVVAAAGIAVVAAALVCVAGERTRRAARLGDDVEDLRRIGAMTGAFGGDRGGVFWTFGWKAGESKSIYPDLNNAATNLQAAANEAVDILRRVAGREDLPPISNWYPHLMYSHLVLEEYAGGGLPSGLWISSADANRLAWAGDPEGFDAGEFGDDQPPPSASNKRWPYSGSYQLGTSFFDTSAPADRICQTAVHTGFYFGTAAVAEGKAVADTAFPSQKVLLQDSHARHFGGYGPNAAPPFFAAPGARLPYLFVDGSVRVHATADGNKGWQPQNPLNTNPTVITYFPSSWEPPTVSGGSSEDFAGHARWTRGFLAGRDFGGPEAGTP